MENSYIHIWKNNAPGSIVQNWAPIIGLNKAINEYWQQMTDDLQYLHTIILNPSGEWTLFDIEVYIEEKEEEEEEESRRALDDNEKYGSYEKQVSNIYNSSRGV